MSWEEAQNTILKFLAAGGIYLLWGEVQKVRTSLEQLNIAVIQLIAERKIDRRDIEEMREEIKQLRELT